MSTLLTVAFIFLKSSRNQNRNLFFGYFLRPEVCFESKNSLRLFFVTLPETNIETCKLMLGRRFIILLKIA